MNTRVDHSIKWAIRGNQALCCVHSGLHQKRTVSRERTLLIYLLGSLPLLRYNNRVMGQ